MAPLNFDGSKKDDDLTPEQRLEVRVILQDALNKIDDEEILQALKSSLLLRLKLCLRVNIGSSGSPLPYPTRFSKRPSLKPAKSIAAIPSPTQSIAAIPSTTQLIVTIPSPTQLIVTIPSPTQPIVTIPSPTQPIVTIPSTTQLSAAKASFVQASSAKLSTAKSSQAKPSAANSPERPKSDPEGRRSDIPKHKNLFPEYFPRSDPVRQVVDPVSPVEEQLAELIITDRQQSRELDTELDTNQRTMEVVNGFNMEREKPDTKEYEPYDLERQLSDLQTLKQQSSTFNG